MKTWICFFHDKPSLNETILHDEKKRINEDTHHTQWYVEYNIGALSLKKKSIVFTYLRRPSTRYPNRRRYLIYEIVIVDEDDGKERKNTPPPTTACHY